MYGNTALLPLKTQASRIARHLRAGAATIDAWVSTEAAGRAQDGAVWRPAVVVASCEPTYDGIIGDGVLLVVELRTELVQRWASTKVEEAWAPWGNGAVAINGSAARIVPGGDVLAAQKHPVLTAPVSLVHPSHNW